MEDISRLQRFPLRHLFIANFTASAAKGRIAYIRVGTRLQWRCRRNSGPPGLVDPRSTDPRTGGSSVLGQVDRGSTIPRTGGLGVHDKGGVHLCCNSGSRIYGRGATQRLGKFLPGHALIWRDHAYLTTHYIATQRRLEPNVTVM